MTTYPIAWMPSVEELSNALDTEGMAAQTEAVRKLCRSAFLKGRVLELETKLAAPLDESWYYPHARLEACREELKELEGGGK